MPSAKSFTLAALGALAIKSAKADVWVQTATWTDSACTVKALTYTNININQLLASSAATSTYSSVITSCSALTAIIGSATSGAVPLDASTKASVGVLAQMLAVQNTCTKTSAGYVFNTCGTSKGSTPKSGDAFLVDSVYSAAGCGTVVAEVGVVADGVCRNSSFVPLGLSAATYSCASVSCNKNGNSIVGTYNAVANGQIPTATTAVVSAATHTASAKIAFLSEIEEVTSKLTISSVGSHNTSYTASTTCGVNDNAYTGALSLASTVYGKYSCDVSGASGGGFSLVSSTSTNSFVPVDNTPMALPGGAAFTINGAGGKPVVVTTSTSPSAGVPIPSGSINTYWSFNTTATGFIADISVNLTKAQLDNFGYDIKALKWAYNTDGTNTWNTVQNSTYDAATGNVAVKTNHFSTWTIVSGKASSVAKMLPSATLAVAAVAATIFFGF